MRWVDALKIWNGQRSGAWCVPRKGSPEHAEVKKIMEGEKSETKAGKPIKAEEPKKEEPPKKKFKTNKQKLEEIKGRLDTATKKEKVKKFLEKVLEARKAKKTEPEPQNPKVMYKQKKKERNDKIVELFKVLDKNLPTLMNKAKKINFGKNMFLYIISPNIFNKVVGSSAPPFESFMNIIYTYKSAAGAAGAFINLSQGGIDIKEVIDPDQPKYSTDAQKIINTELAFEGEREY